MVAEIMVRNVSTNQEAAFCGKSLECVGMLIRLEGHFGKFTVLYGGNKMNGLKNNGQSGRKDNGQKPDTQMG